MPGTHAAHSDPDIYDDAMTDRPQVGFGQVITYLYRVVLIKGQGKVQYNPEIHQGKNTSVAIDFTIKPIDPSRPIVSANTMLDWTSEFTQVVRPSINLLAEKIASIKGIEVDNTFNPLREIDGMFAKYEWVLRPDNKPGETWKTLNFLDVYPDKESCKVSSEFADAPQSLDEVKEIPFPGEESDAEKLQRQKDTMWPFVVNMWRQSGNNVDVFIEKLCESEPFSKLYSADDPKIVELIMSSQ